MDYDAENTFEQIPQGGKQELGISLLFFLYYFTYMTMFYGIKI